MCTGSRNGCSCTTIKRLHSSLCDWGSLWAYQILNSPNKELSVSTHICRNTPRESQKQCATWAVCSWTFIDSPSKRLSKSKVIWEEWVDWKTSKRRLTVNQPSLACLQTVKALSDQAPHQVELLTPVGQHLIILLRWQQIYSQAAHYNYRHQLNWKIVLGCQCRWPPVLLVSLRHSQRKESLAQTTSHNIKENLGLHNCKKWIERLKTGRPHLRFSTHQNQQNITLQSERIHNSFRKLAVLLFIQAHCSCLMKA